MFQHLSNPSQRTLPERGMTLMLTLALVFVFVSIFAFARATRGRDVSARTAEAPRGAIQCTTEDGTVVLVGEIVTLVSLPRE